MFSSYSNIQIVLLYSKCCLHIIIMYYIYVYSALRQYSLHSCCVFRLIVPLEGEPSVQSEVLNALDWVFISIFWWIELFFYSGKSLSHCRWKTAHNMRLLPAHFTFGMVLCRWWAELIERDAWNWGSSNQGISFLTVWGSFRCFFLQIPSVFSCVFTEERIEFGQTAIKPRLLECCSDVCPSVGFSYLLIWPWRSTRVTIRFFVSNLTKALLHQLLSLARRPALGRVLVVSNLFH